MSVAFRMRMAAGGASFNPLSGWTTDPVHAFWASDPLWTPNGTGATDGAAVVQMRNGGTGYTQGAYLSGSGLVLPGVAGNYASTPDSAAVSVTGDIDLIVKAAATDWTPAARMWFIGKTQTTLSYAFGLNTAGTLGLLLSQDGATSTGAISSVATGVSDGATKWVRATWRQSDGRVQFFLSDDGSSWSQLGTDQSIAYASINDSSLPLAIGQRNTTSGTEPFAGTIYRAIVKSGIDGTTVLDADFSAVPAGRSAFIESSSNAAVVMVWSTVNPSQNTGSAQPAYRAATAAFGNKPAVQFTTDDVLLANIADISQPYWVVAIAQHTSATSTQGIYGIGTSTAYRYGIASVPPWKWRTLVTVALEAGTADTSAHLHVTKWDGATSVMQLDGAALASGDTGTAADLTVLSLGAGNNGTSGGAFLEGHIAYLAVFSSDPTADANWSRFKAWVTSFYGITVA